MNGFERPAFVAWPGVTALVGRVIDEYRTIAERARSETKVEGSRFIATAAPSSGREAAENFIAGVRREFHDATHNCYAYRLGADGAAFRFNDDGEPGGTAGKPILTAIDTCGLTDLVVVVTRYFGGTKLGIGGLVRAYGDAAGRVLRSSSVITRYQTETVRASFPHPEIGHVMHVMTMLGGRIVDTTYDEEVHLHIEIRRSKAEELRTALVNGTKGNIRLSGEG